KVLGAFHDLQGDRGLDVLGQGDGLVGRPGPAGTLDVGPTQAHALLEVFQWDVQDLGQIGEDLFSPVLHALEFVVVGRHRQFGPVVDHRPARGVEDLTTGGGHDEFLSVVGHSKITVVVGHRHLQVPQAYSQNGKEHQDQDLSQNEPGPAQAAAG